MTRWFRVVATVLVAGLTLSAPAFAAGVSPLNAAPSNVPFALPHSSHSLSSDQATQATTATSATTAQMAFQLNGLVGCNTAAGYVSVWNGTSWGCSNNVASSGTSGFSTSSGTASVAQQANGLGASANCGPGTVLTVTNGVLGCTGSISSAGYSTSSGVASQANGLWSSANCGPGAALTVTNGAFGCTSSIASATTAAIAGSAQALTSYDGGNSLRLGWGAGCLALKVDGTDFGCSVPANITGSSGYSNSSGYAASSGSTQYAQYTNSSGWNPTGSSAYYQAITNCPPGGYLQNDATINGASYSQILCNGGGGNGGVQ